MPDETPNATQSWLNPKSWLQPNRRRPVMFAGAVVIAALLGIAFFKPEKVEPFKAEAVKQTTLSKSISATGTLQALQSVQVG